MRCKVCGTENLDDFTFCAGCGAVLGDSDGHADRVEEPVFTKFAQEPTSNPAPAADVPPVNPGGTMGMLGMIFGVASVVMMLTSCVCAITIYVAPLLAVAGFICSIIGMRKSKKAGFKNGYAVGGLLASLVTLLLVLLAILLLVLYFVGTIALGITLPFLTDYSQY